MSHCLSDADRLQIMWTRIIIYDRIFEIRIEIDC